MALMNIKLNSFENINSNNRIEKYDNLKGLAIHAIIMFHNF